MKTRENELREALRALLVECSQHVPEDVDCPKLRAAADKARALLDCKEYENGCLCESCSRRGWESENRAAALMSSEDRTALEKRHAAFRCPFG